MNAKNKWTFFFCLCVWSVSTETYSNEVNYYVIAEQARPFQIETNGQNHEGIITDIVQTIFANSEHTVKYHTYPFNRMISLLEAGGEPNWITYGSPTWGKVQAKNLSEVPIYTVKHTLVTSTLQPFSFNDIEDIKGKGLVLLMGFDYPQLNPYLSQDYVEEIRVKNYQAAFRVVNRTPGDTAFVEMESRVNYNIKQLGLDPNLFLLQPFDAVIPNYNIYLAFSPEMEPAIQQFINQRLKEIKQSGELTSIIEKYL